MMAEGKYTQENIEMSDKQKKAQRARSIVLALALCAFVVILYVATFSKFGANLMANGS